MGRDLPHRFLFQADETSLELNEAVLRKLDASGEILITDRRSTFGDLRTALRDYQCSYETTPVPRNLFEDGNQTDIRWDRAKRMTLAWLDKLDGRTTTVARTMKVAVSSDSTPG